MASSLQEHSDDDLASLVREGRNDAYAELYRRHSGTALRYARRFVAPADAHDVAQESFLRILRALRRDEGPRDGFVGYLLRTVRNLVTDRSRRTEAVPMEPVEIEGAFDELDPDHAHTLVERDVLSRAFASLPDQWQRVLWLTEVEGLPPRELVPEFAASSNAVAQLSRRAREGLRGAWLQAHVLTREADPDCRESLAVLADYDRGRLGAARAARVDAHLVGCASCTAVLADLRELSVRLPVLLLPVVLGGASSFGGFAGAPAPAGGGAHDGAGVTSSQGAAGSPVQAVAGASGHGARALGRGLRALGSSSQGVAAAVAAGVVIVAGVALGAAALRGGGASPDDAAAPQATDSAVATPAPPGPDAVQPPSSGEGSLPSPETLPQPPAPAPDAETVLENGTLPRPHAHPVAAPGRQPEPRPGPAPAPARPAPTDPAPDPTDPAPDPTDPVPEPPPAPTADGPAPGSYRAPVVLSGTALPGAFVRVLDQTGATVATTTADAAGSWTTTPAPGAPDVPTTYSATQTSDGLSSPASAATGAYVFEAPRILTPQDGETVTAYPGGLVPFQLQVPAGTPYTVTVDGVTTAFPALGTDTTLDYVLDGMTPGVHEIATRFVDPAGDGALRRVVFRVVDPAA